MAITHEELARRLQEKTIATPEDFSKYVALTDRQDAIQVDGDLIPLLPRGANRPYSTGDGDGDEPALHWQGNSPDIVDTPVGVDLYEEQTGVSNQFGRSTCVAFAALAALEHRLKKEGHGEIDLSEQYANWLFMRLEGEVNQCREWLETRDSADYLSYAGVCDEGAWGYENWATASKQCSPKLPETAKKGPFCGIRRYARIDGPGILGPKIGNTDYLECLLSHGHSVVVSIEMAIGRDGDAGDGIFDVYRDGYGNPRASKGGHAMLLIGYQRAVNGSKPYFIFKNSWGRNYQHGGYIYLSYDYIRIYANYGYIVLEVDRDKAPLAELSGLEILRFNRSFRSKGRYYFLDRKGASISVPLPVLTRTDATENIDFRVSTVGSSVRYRNESFPASEDSLLPKTLEIEAMAKGVSHLILSAYFKESGRPVRSIRPLRLSFDVRD